MKRLVLIALCAFFLCACAAAPPRVHTTIMLHSDDLRVILASTTETIMMVTVTQKNRCRITVVAVDEKRGKARFVVNGRYSLAACVEIQKTVQGKQNIIVTNLDEVDSLDLADSDME